jgi:type IV pilus assembly protein PilV
MAVKIVPKRVPARRDNQSGVVLLEVLVAVLIFSIGILGMIGMQAASITAVSDAKYRSEAAMAADQLIARMWADQANIAAYSTGGVAVALEGFEAKLPDGKRQVDVGAVPVSPIPGVVLPAMRTVTVTITWQPPESTTVHTFVTETQISSAI